MLHLLSEKLKEQKGVLQILDTYTIIEKGGKSLFRSIFGVEIVLPPILTAITISLI